MKSLNTIISLLGKSVLYFSLSVNATEIMTLSEHNGDIIFKKGSTALVKATISGEQRVPPVLCAILLQLCF